MSKLYKCYTNVLCSLGSYETSILYKNTFYFKLDKAGCILCEKYFFCDFSSGISYLIIKNQMSTNKICNIMCYRVSLIQFTKK